MQIQANHPSLNNLIQELTDQYRRWGNVLDGSFDQSIESETNLQMLRSRILTARKQIALLYPDEVKPSVYYFYLPPVVKPSLMATAIEIRRNARKTLLILQKSKNYIYLIRHFSRLPSEIQEAELYMRDKINHIQFLANAIEDDDLLFLRWHHEPAVQLKCQKTAARRLRSLLAVRQENFDQIRGIFVQKYFP